MRTASIIVAACLLVVVATAQPVIFWASDPVGPNETVLVFGHGFGQEPRVRLARYVDRDPRWPEAGPKMPRDAVTVEALQPSNESLKFVIPADWDPGTYLFRITGPEGASDPFPLNAPTIYWCQGDAGSGASPGGWLRVFGRCMGREGRPTKVMLLRAQGEPVRSFDASDVTPWSATVALPEDLRPGSYQVCVQQGGAVSWRSAARVQVAEHDVWPDQVFNVRDFGASGDGLAHDGACIRAALQAAEDAGGGVVYLPRGRYQIEGTLELPERVVLRGEENELVCLFWPDTDEPYTLVQGTHHFGLEDLTLYASNHVHCIAGEIGTPDAGHTFLRRVCVRADMYRGHLTPDQVDTRFRAALRHSTGGPDTVRLGGEDVEITECDLYGSGRCLYLHRVRGGRVSRNTFYNGRWGWYCIDGSDGLILEENEIIGGDLMSTGGGLNCLGSQYSQNVYYADNHVLRTHGWDREAMTSDAGGGAYYGSATEIGPDRLVLAEDPNWQGKTDWTGAGVFIMAGRGMGQYRRIAAYEGREVTLDQPWAVSPDTASILSITMLQRQYLFIGNEFEDVGIALQYYGTSVDHVAADNLCTRGGGFYASGRWYHHFQPSWYCQFLGNTITEGNCYRFGPNNATDAGLSFLGTWGCQAQGGTTPLALAHVHRRNHLMKNAELQFLGFDPDHPGLRDVVAEHNTVENSPRGAYVDSGCVGLLLRENTFVNCEREVVSDADIRAELLQRRAALLDQQDPVAAYTFDEVQGPSVRDESGHGFWARATGPIGYVTGVSGKAPRFEGTHYFVVSDDRMLQFPRLTVSAWIMPDQTEGRWGIVAKRNGNVAAPYVLAIRQGGLTFEATDAKGQWSYNFTSPVVVKPGEWSHVAAVCEEGVGVRLYCNGQLVAEQPATEALIETAQPLTIGFEAWGGADSQPGEPGNFRGLIDEVKLWSRLLSPEEIAAEYEALREHAQAESLRMAEEAAARAERARQFESGLALDGGVRWKLVAFDDFEQAELGPEWRTLRGRWTLNEGRLTCRETSFLAYRERVSAPIRIEFDARSEHPGDLTAFWGTVDEAYNGGYFIGFASNGNTANKILRLGEQVATNDGPLAEPGRWHHVIGQVFAGKVQLIVDGSLALEYADNHPLTTAHTAGLIAWSEGEFDNVRIYGAA